MLKALFIIGQCIRLLHTDPWESETLKVLEVGKYSYRVEKPLSHGFENRDRFPIRFENQKDYEAVSCPDLEKADDYE